MTTKVITIGGAKGTVGWVDLWRGILLFDVLDELPELRNVPLPLPSKGTWPLLSTRAETLSDSCCFVRTGSWKVNTWNMPIPVNSWKDWKLGCSFTSNRMDNILKDFGRRMHFKSNTAALSVKRGTAYPTLSIADDDDDGVVYLLHSKGTTRMVLTVNARTWTLMRCFLSCGISKHLNTTACPSCAAQINASGRETERLNLNSGLDAFRNHSQLQAHHWSRVTTTRLNSSKISGPLSMALRGLNVGSRKTPCKVNQHAHI
uniref:DUF1618 domain-containing protein n=1 Tax=Leersia perrieri TaxID=77586 RepID=A0A0D9WJI3_9ORYZ